MGQTYSHVKLKTEGKPIEHLVSTCISALCAKLLQSCLTLCHPMDYSPPGSSVHWIFQARILEWVAISYSKHLHDPGIEPTSLISPALAGRFFTTSTAWEAQTYPHVKLETVGNPTEYLVRTCISALGYSIIYFIPTYSCSLTQEKHVVSPQSRSRRNRHTPSSAYNHLVVTLFIFFYFTILHWFCHTSTCIHHRCTRAPHPEPHSHLPPHTIPLDHPSAPAPIFLYPALNLLFRRLGYFHVLVIILLPS